MNSRRRRDVLTAAERERALAQDAAKIAGQSADWLRIAQRHGIDVVLAVLDEWGGEKLHVIQREHFLREIFRPAIDAAIVERFERDESASEIARAMGITRRRVYRALCRVRGGRVTARHGKQGE